MTTFTRDEILQLALMLVIVFAAWHYHRRKSFPAELKYATFWPRVLAGAVDACVFWPIGIIFTRLVARGLPMEILMLLMPLPSALWWLYSVGLHARGGQTFGKMACRVKLVEAGDEKPASAGRAFRRDALPIVLSIGCIGYAEVILQGMKSQAGAETTGAADPINQVINLVVIVAVMPVLWYLLELLTMLANPQRRALHDLLAGTVIIRTNTE